MNWKSRSDEIECILNTLTPNKFNLVEARIINSGITTAQMLGIVVSSIFEKAVFEPTMYAQLCCNLWSKLPSFPSGEPDGKEITFKRLLLNNCQEAFEGADYLRAELRQMTAPEQDSERRYKEKIVKLRTLGNICFIGELWKRRLVPEKIVHYIIKELLGINNKICPEEENVEASCHLFNTIGKQLDEGRNSRQINQNDIYFNRLKELSTSQQLAPHIRFMAHDVIDLRSNKWIPRRGEEKAKTITEMRTVAEKNMGHPAGSNVSIRNRAGTGGMMPGWIPRPPYPRTP